MLVGETKISSKQTTSWRSMMNPRHGSWDGGGLCVQAAWEPRGNSKPQAQHPTTIAAFTIVTLCTLGHQVWLIPETTNLYAISEGQSTLFIGPYCPISVRRLRIA